MHVYIVAGSILSATVLYEKVTSSQLFFMISTLIESSGKLFSNAGQYASADGVGRHF